MKLLVLIPLICFLGILVFVPPHSLTSSEKPESKKEEVRIEVDSSKVLISFSSAKPKPPSTLTRYRVLVRNVAGGLPIILEADLAENASSKLSVARNDLPVSGDRSSHYIFEVFVSREDGSPFCGELVEKRLVIFQKDK